MIPAPPAIQQSGTLLTTTTASVRDMASIVVASAQPPIHGVTDVQVKLLEESAGIHTSADEDVSPVASTVGTDIDHTAERPTDAPGLPLIPDQPPACPAPEDGPLRIELSIDGMTCVACVNTIMSLLSEIQGVSEAAVNLLGKSATAVVQYRNLIPQVEETINDAGYEAEVVNTQPVVAPGQLKVLGPRTVSLCVVGMLSP